jgi:hypothetical protein
MALFALPIELTLFIYVQVVKAIWAYIKENNLQDPKNKQKIIVDEKLATFLKAPVTMFSMNKQLSKHIGGAKFTCAKWLITFVQKT